MPKSLLKSARRSLLKFNRRNPQLAFSLCMLLAISPLLLLAACMPTMVSSAELSPKVPALAPVAQAAQVAQVNCPTPPPPPHVVDFCKTYQPVRWAPSDFNGQPVNASLLQLKQNNAVYKRLCMDTK